MPGGRTPNHEADLSGQRRTTTAVIVSRDNGYGLTVDARIFADALREIGISAEIAQARRFGRVARWLGPARYDLVFHLERIHRSWLHAGREHLLVPNQERFPSRHVRRLRKVDAVLAKTGHARQIFADLGCKVVHVGFASRDLHDSAIEKDWRKFLHIAGGSTLKGTEDIIDLWEKHPEWPTLFLVQKPGNMPKSLPSNVEAAREYLSDSQLHDLMNGCGVHLCPSRSEGWGHYIHEALGCGAVVVTTDAPPMNEFVDSQSGILVQVARSEKRHLGTNFFVDPASLEEAIETILTTKPETLARMGENARHAFVRNSEAFPQRLSQALAEILS